jgi:hypothetical protein
VLDLRHVTARGPSPTHVVSSMRWWRRRRKVNTRDAPAPSRARTLASQHIQIIVDDVLFEVKVRRKTTAEDAWEEYLRIQWSAVRAIEFATDRHDPIVALYFWTVAGKRHHVADSGFLSQSEWARLGKMIAESTRGRLTLDLSGRDNPRSTSPDW